MLPWCLRDNVARDTLNCFATLRYEKDALGSRDSIAAIAFLIRVILVEMRRVEVGMMHVF
jgi:hypothetical protein